MLYAVRYRKDYYLVAGKSILTALLRFIIKYHTMNVSMIESLNHDYNSVDFLNTKGSGAYTDCPF